MPVLPDGSVTASAQYGDSIIDEDMLVTGSMIGLILSVNPSDNEDNLSSGVTSDDRGWRNECRVLIVDANSEPNLILENVVIPPSSHSGLDNFDEDLPRGLNKDLIGGMEVPEHFAGIDVSELDAEWCVVNFVGGSIDRPYIENWWNHPRNNYDQATSGGDFLTQVDIKKNKFRKVRRINGTKLVVSQKGDIYIDTTEANANFVLDKKPTRKEYDPGGSIQIDVKKTQQLEFNWNKPVEGLSASSDDDNQTRDPSLPHYKHSKGAPAAREKTRTYIRGKEYDVLVHTSKLAIVGEAGGEYAGEVDLLIDKLINMKSKDKFVLEGQTIQVGSASSTEPIICGDLWVTLMEKLIDAISTITVSTPVGPSVPPVLNKPIFDAIKAEIIAKTQLSDFVTTQKVKPT